MSDSDSGGESYGPCRPPESQTRSFIGPAVPAAFKPNSQPEFPTKEEESITLGKDGFEMGKNETMGKVEDLEDVIGPSPPSMSSSHADEDVIEAFERRAEKMREKLMNQGKEERLVREDWMLKLPEVGGGRRLPYTVEKKSFNQSSSSYDAGRDQLGRTMWTETPEERQQRERMGGGGGGQAAEDGKEDAESMRLKERDEAMKRMVEEHNKIASRNKSLLESHKEKLKKKKRKHTDSSSSSSSSSSSQIVKKNKKKKKDKKKRKEDKKEKKKKDRKKESGKVERRPFDRDVDLKGGGPMSAQARETIIKNSSQLASRFSHGNKSHFL